MSTWTSYGGCKHDTAYIIQDDPYMHTVKKWCPHCRQEFMANRMPKPIVTGRLEVVQESLMTEKEAQDKGKAAALQFKAIFVIQGEIDIMNAMKFGALISTLFSIPTQSTMDFAGGFVHELQTKKNLVEIPERIVESD